MPTLNELLEQNKDALVFADDAARDAAVEALKKHANPLYLAINNLGFGAAQAKFTQQVTDAKADAKTKIDAAETRATKAETDLKTAIEKAPEVKTINEQWEAKLEGERATHKKEQQKLADRIRNSLVQRDQSTLAAEMHEKHHVPLSMAKTLVKDPDLLSRLTYDDNGSLSVLQAGQQIPIVPGSGQTHLGFLAAEIAATVEKDILVSDGDQGSGVSGGAAPGGGDAGFFKQVAANARKEQEALKPKVSLQERMKNR